MCGQSLKLRQDVLSVALQFLFIIQPSIVLLFLQVLEILRDILPKRIEQFGHSFLFFKLANLKLTSRETITQPLENMLPAF